MRKEKIIFAIPSLETFGGEEKVLLNWINEVKKHKKVEIVTGYYNPCKTYSGFNATIIDGGIKPGNFIWRQLKMMKFFWNYKAGNFDRVIAFGFPSTLMTHNNSDVHWYCNTPPKFIYETKKYVGGILQIPALIYAGIVKLIDRVSVHKINYIYANSNHIQRKVKNYYGMCANVVYPGVHMPQKSYHPKFSKVLLSVGRLCKEKRIDRVVKAMVKLQDYKLYVVGDGPEKERLISYAYQLGLKNVIFKGKVTEAALKKLYKTCYAVISIPKDEDFGLIPIEANAYGKMCIGVDEGGMKETIKEGITGILMKKPYSIVGAVHYIEIITPEHQEAWCTTHAKTFSWKRFYEGVKYSGDY